MTTNSKNIISGDQSPIINIEGVDKSTLIIKQTNILEDISETIEKSGRSEAQRKDAQDQLNKMNKELQKKKPDKGRIKRCWEDITRTIPEVAKVVPWKKLIEKVLNFI